MQFIRPFVEERFAPTAFNGYRNYFSAYLESATIIGSKIVHGGCGPGLHHHPSDQIYFMLEGETNVQLGLEVHKAGPGTLVFVPAGTAHRNWNDSGAEEFHFEMIVPTVRPGLPLLTFVDSPEDAPGSSTPAYLKQADPGELRESVKFPGFRLQGLANESLGVTSCVINHAEVDPGKAGPGTHVHDFDQFYFVLDGELHVEVGLHRAVATKHTLVVLPAGVPHRQWNEGSATERHLAVLTPAPEAGKPWDHGVQFGPTGETF